MNPELYYAIVNILDWYTKDKKCYESDIGTHNRVMKCLTTLQELGHIDIEDISDANDCGKCESWTELIYEFAKLWENGERV